jgi:xanthine phosphoribosyltransferase
MSGDTYSSVVHSFTHGTDNHIVVTREYLPAGEKVLIVDDFLAHGSALNGMISIVEEAGCEVVGCCAVIEKGFQHGGDSIREKGYRVESLAIIDEMTEFGIVFREQ